MRIFNTARLPVEFLSAGIHIAFDLKSILSTLWTDLQHNTSLFLPELFNELLDLQRSLLVEVFFFGFEFFKKPQEFPCMDLFFL